MSNKNRLLIGCSVGLVAAIALLAVGAYLAYRALRRPFREMSQAPAELRQPRVLNGDGLLSKEVFSSDRRLSQIETMAFGQVEPGRPDELCSVSNFGALFLDTEGAVKRYTPYGMQQMKVLGMKLQSAASRISRFQIVDLGGNGECSFLARDGAMGSELIAHDGKSVWQLGGLDFRSHPADMIAGDLYGDGKTEFVAAYEIGGRGLVLYDASLNEVWSKPEIRASHIELLDSDNGKKNIACSDYSLINILDSQGNQVNRLRVQPYVHEFLILTWPPSSGGQYALFHDQDNADLYDLNGKMVFKCEMPGGSHLNRLRAEPFMVGKVPYLAIVGSTVLSQRRSIFCVSGLPEHPLRNQIVNQSPLYQEVLGEGYQSIAKLPADDSGRESIVIGGLNQILRYRPRSLPSEPPKPRLQ